MGLFLSEEGRLQGWLAALLCCCVALHDDEAPMQKRNTSIPPPLPSNTLCDQQPTPLPPPAIINHIAAPHTNNRASSDSFTHHHRLHPISDRPPSLKPLDLGDSSWSHRFSFHTRRKSSTTLMGRISIGKPTDFRRLEYTEKQRMSLVPLQLDPVVLKREPTPDPEPACRHFSSRSVDDLFDRPFRASSRGPPVERCHELTSISLDRTVPSDGFTTDTQKEFMPARPPLSTQSSSSSIRSLRRTAGDARPSSGSASSRNSFEKPRIKRKRSGLKQSSDVDVEREILELNTIVEERRAESARPQTPVNYQHVPAVAPHMPVRARSETLSEIGSAFSRPFISLATSPAPGGDTVQSAAPTLSPLTPDESRLSRPFASMPDLSMERPSQRHIRRPSSRVTGWLSNIFSTTLSLNSADTHGPEERCRTAGRRRHMSETSLCTTTSELESHAFTPSLSSSPMSKQSHSRSLTAESRFMTPPTSPPSTVDGMLDVDHKSRGAEPWPVYVDSHSQVGLAL